jgi:hypothetical protein
MGKEKIYTLSNEKGSMFLTLSRLTKIFTLLFLLIVKPDPSFGQTDTEYDEVSVYLKVQGIGGADIPALIKDEVVYLSVSDIFNLIKIKNTPSARLDSLSGFFINPQDEYLIDRVKRQITFQGKKIELKPEDLIKTQTNLYMKSGLFGLVFGLNCAFNMRDLSVMLTTKLELPLIREMKMEQMRNNLKRLKGDVKTDSTIGRRYPLLKFGMADWAVTSTQLEGGASNTQMSLSLGSVVAGGEMNVGLNYNQGSKLDLSQQTYVWRYVNNDFKAFRQILVGKIGTQTISSINGSLIGIQMTNTPTIYRRSFGTYTLSNVTEPGWLVELYVNNVLVDYVKADASGFYKFEVPLVYGISVLTVRMYGPWGEVRTRVENANIPYNFLPAGDLEYSINAGVLENEPSAQLYRTTLDYGINRHMSVGGGYEYYSSSSGVNSLPFVGTSVMLLSDLLIASEYTFGVQLKNSLNYRLPSNLQLDLNYTSYEKGQKAILIAPIAERSASISVPVQSKKISLYTRLSLSQMIYSDYKTTSSEFLISGNLNGISSNITTSMIFQNPKQINASSNFSLSFRLPGRFIMMPSFIYDYNKRSLMSVHCSLEKPLFGKGYLNIAYDRNIITKINSVNIGLRYDFSFMQTSIATTLKKNSNSFSQSARGSLLVDGKYHYVGTSNTSMVGRCGFTFIAYLDLNGNGKRDKNEPLVPGLNVRVNGGRLVKNVKDSTVRVLDLTPYTSYLVELDKNNFDNISWQIKNKTLSVFADPNQLKMIEIPIAVMAEAAGTVNVKTKDGTRGLSRVYVNFYRNGKTLVGRTLTESDGYFSYMGLQPGKYLAMMDSSQLTKIKMVSTPQFKEFKVKESKDGDFIEGLDFTLQSTVNDSTERLTPKEEPKNLPKEVKADEKIINYASTVSKKADTISGSLNKPESVNKATAEKNPPFVVKQVPITVKQVTKTKSNISDVKDSKSIPATSKLEKGNPVVANTISKSVPVSKTADSSLTVFAKKQPRIDTAKTQGYSVRFGSYKSESEALLFQQKITTTTGKPVLLTFVDGNYTLWIEGFSTSQDAMLFLSSLERIDLKVNVNEKLLLPKNVTPDSDLVIGNKNLVTTVNKSKAINYGPLELQNKYLTYSDSVGKIYTFDPKNIKLEIQTRISNVDETSTGKHQPLTIIKSDSQETSNDKKTSIKGQQFSVQIGDFIFDQSAVRALKKVSSITKLPVTIVIRKGFYNLVIDGFPTRKEANQFIDHLTQLGYQGAIIRDNS